MPIPLRTLIIEDSAQDADLLIRELRRGGYEPQALRVQTAEALEAALARQEWDIVFGDYSMPHFSGMDALRMVRARGLDVPFIFVSGTIGEDVAVAAMRAGAQDYVMKGNLKRLLPAVERELREAELRRSHARIDAERRAAEARFRNILTMAADAVIAVDTNQNIAVFNRGAEQIFGYATEEIIGQPLDRLLPERYRGAHRAHLETFAIGAETSRPMRPSGEVYGRRKDGSEFPAEATVSKLIENGRTTLTVILRDVTERKRAEEHLFHLAHHDALTGLPNPIYLHKRLEQAFADAAREQVPFALLMLNLSRLHEINETLGRDNGDELLRQLAARLLRFLRRSDMAARVAGDEFALLLYPHTAAEATASSEALLRSFEMPFDIAGFSIELAAHVGIALAPEHATNPRELMQHADVALSLARQSHLSSFIYDPLRDPTNPQRLLLLADLRAAVNGGALTAHFQPKICLTTGAVRGVEALVRWPHPQRGRVPPDEFIPLAERSGLIGPLTRTVLDMAIRHANAWGLKGWRVPVAVNLSVKSARDRDIIAMIEQLLTRQAIEPWMLELEITETALMEDPLRSLKILAELRDLGITLSIDDFGTGYSSLAYLKRLPVKAVKIDKSFVLDMTENEDSMKIVRSTIALAHDLGLKVVAEGVENEAILERLRDYGCDEAQGFHIGRPMPADELDAWLALRLS
jgi:diguanylate cyclase (GGDEF)-like protein/PAS domain S-box-containing protein